MNPFNRLHRREPAWDEVEQGNEINNELRRIFPMHKPGCPKYNSPYGDCQCDAMEQREYTEQLRRYNENVQQLGNLIEQLQSDNAELRERVKMMETHKL